MVRVSGILTDRYNRHFDLFQEANTDDDEDEADLDDKLNDYVVDNGANDENGYENNDECGTDDDVALDVNVDSNDEDVEPTEEDLPNGEENGSN